MQPAGVGEGEEVGVGEGVIEGVGEALPSPPPPPEVHAFDVSHVPEEQVQAVRSAVGVEFVTQGVHSASAPSAE